MWFLFNIDVGAVAYLNYMLSITNPNSYVQREIRMQTHLKFRGYEKKNTVVALFLHDYAVLSCRAGS
jgi:hypothetical protein